MIQSRLLVAWGQSKRSSDGQEGTIMRVHKETFGNDGYAYNWLSWWSHARMHM